MWCISDYCKLLDCLPPYFLLRPRIVKRDDFRRVGYAYWSVLAEVCSLDDIGTVGVVYQAFRVLVLNSVYEDWWIIQKLAKGISVGDASLGLCFLKKKRYSVRAEYQSVVSLFAFRLIHYATKVYKVFNITNFSEKLFLRSIVKCINYFLFTLTGWGNIWTHYLNVGMRGYLCYQVKFNTFVERSERISLLPQFIRADI